MVMLSAPALGAPLFVDHEPDSVATLQRCPDVVILTESELSEVELCSWCLACYGDDGLAALTEVDV